MNKTDWPKRDPPTLPDPPWNFIMCPRLLRNRLWSRRRHVTFLLAVGSAMMNSQGPSLSKGFPEEETGASHMSENSNGNQDSVFRRLEAFASDI